jgi:hypothetical protein
MFRSLLIEVVFGAGFKLPINGLFPTPLLTVVGYLHLINVLIHLHRAYKADRRLVHCSAKRVLEMGILVLAFLFPCCHGARIGVHSCSFTFRNLQAFAQRLLFVFEVGGLADDPRTEFFEVDVLLLAVNFQVEVVVVKEWLKHAF